MTQCDNLIGMIRNLSGELNYDQKSRAVLNLAKPYNSAIAEKAPLFEINSFVSLYKLTANLLEEEVS